MITLSMHLFKKMHGSLQTNYSIEKPVVPNIISDKNQKSLKTLNTNREFNGKTKSVHGEQNGKKVDSENAVPVKLPAEVPVENPEVPVNARRTFVGRVEERRGRIIFEKPHGFEFNLNDGVCNFNPMVGDWLSIECKKKDDSDAEYSQIVTVSPLRRQRKFGVVTHYDEENDYGKIDNQIIFNKLICSNGYFPCEKDHVIIDCIESEQLGKQWRAIVVYPYAKMRKFQRLQKIQDDATLDNEHGIEISQDLSMSLMLNEEKEMDILVKNTGKKAIFLKECKLQTKKKNMQISLSCPKEQRIQISPCESAIITLICSAKMLGVSYEKIKFKFNNCEIDRYIELNVMPNEECDQDPEANFTREDGIFIPGIKPYKTPKFVDKKLINEKVPENIKKLMEYITNQKLSDNDEDKIVCQKILCLGSKLEFSNYVDRFRQLLFFERVAIEKHMDRYKIDSAILEPREGFLSVDVPGLLEKRPSLKVGDHIILTRKGDPRKLKYGGYIHKVKNSSILLKFNEKFHSTYNNEECQVEFTCSMKPINRCFAALNEAHKNLKQEILFPMEIKPKEPQYYFKNDEIDNCKDDVIDNTDENDNFCSINKSVKQISLIWHNENLNIYQKRAVANILRGIARPLPYIIFGPPGTGKTMTLCETILQIATAIPGSRILIATPSNNAADVIAARLIQSQKIITGQLVRLVAHSYFESDNIPEDIRPYCVTVDISSEGSNRNVNILHESGARLNCTKEIIGRHKITIGTCSALGILHNIGFEKGKFTHIVIDEAGQATEPELMIPLSLGCAESCQIVLAGDPKQLGPIIISQLSSTYGLSHSYLYRLLQTFPYQRDDVGFPETGGYDPRLITKLLYSYRSLPELLSLPSALFYHSELKSKVDPQDSPEAELLQKLEGILPKRLGSNPPPIVFQEVQGKNARDSDSPSWYNEEEAQVCIDHLKRLYNEGLKASDIGILTPYDKQVQKIRELIKQAKLDLPKVGSVETFQGDERNVIILSSVRSNRDLINQDVEQALGFVRLPERLNVAITRAKSLLIIIGNPDILNKDFNWRRVISCCKAKKSYVGRTFDSH